MRVQIPAYTDMWMRGARFGEVIKTFKRHPRAANGQILPRVECARVRLDLTGKDCVVILNDCTPVD